MTKSRSTISLPKDQVAKIRQEIHAGRVRSVSDYITRALTQHETGGPLQALLQDLIQQHGEPPAKNVRWAERALAPRKRRR